MNLHSRFVLILSILLISFNAHAEVKKPVFAECIIQLERGKTLEGYIRMPLRTIGKFAFHETIKGSKKMIEVEEVEAIILKGANGDALLRATQCYNLKFGGKIKLTDHKALLLLDMNCTNMTTYYGVMSVEVDSEGEIYSIYPDGIGYYFVDRKMDKYPVFAGYMFARYEDGSVKGNGMDGKMAEKTRRILLKKYFEGEDKHINYIDAQDKFTEHQMLEYLSSLCIKEEEDESK